MSTKITLSIENLTCANCAAKIEAKIAKMHGIKEANLDFLGQKISITSDKKIKTNEFIKEIQALVDSIEDGVLVSEKKANLNSHESLQENTKTKLIALKIAVGSVIFAFALAAPIDHGLKFALLFISYLIIGGGVVANAARNIIKGRVFDENFLMSIATIGAFAIGEYSEAVAVMLFYRIGELFQETAVNKSRKSIASLMDIRPEFANLKLGAQVQKISPQKVQIGDLIVVKPGEKVPLDGEIVEGFSTFDTSALTGESLPKEIGVGQSALSGYINKSALVTIKVSKIFAESTVSKILDLVQNASSKKSKTENFITKFARYYTPSVVFIALIIAFVPPLVFNEELAAWVYKALVFLVISCPCALVVSIPLGFFGGIAGASRHGILIKGANYLEALNSVDTVVFDKTGTLTKGIFKVSQIELNDKILQIKNQEEFLKLVAHAEFFSTHPVATSIVKEYERVGGNIDESLVLKFEEIAGQGIKANINGKEIVAGNAKFMLSQGVKFKASTQLETVLYAAIDGKFAGKFIITDELKTDAKEAILQIKKEGSKEIVMLTGDNQNIAQNIANKLSITKFFAELLPTQKVEILEEILAQKAGQGKVAFVGDGINDAPVLARADVGVAMGAAGSDAAIEAADIVIMNDEPSKVATAIKIAKKTRTIVWQNIVFALGVKVAIMIMGALGYATMWEAVFGDVGVALIAILNSIRAMR
ncbi:heavy metal translocating P-type ATPase [Campylobacter sp. RM16188]|uniref:heavy metal translocating P-type ATPase n=1 Tax=Campylobacter sp. RM16188 TaxID=1705725 RepID=UPI0015578D4F|nr:heavy metal translocating P-type ATPase [Campylobacter sp. RM16188]